MKFLSTMLRGALRPSGSTSSNLVGSTDIFTRLSRGRLASALVDSVLPPTCLACEQLVMQRGGLCSSCWSRTRFIARPYCEVLGKPFSLDLGRHIVSPEAIAHPPAFDCLRAAVLYDDVARRLVSGLKFADRTDLAPWMAKWMFIAAKELVDEVDLIASVPLHRMRLLSRRYNQSAELARHVARFAGLDFDPLLVTRRRQTRQQVGLTSNERDRNVRGAFTVPTGKRPDVDGRTILLVDDVFTTGATVNAVARSLGRAGAARIFVLTFAMVETNTI